MNNSRVAVILINYNGLEDTLECIESIKKNDMEVDIIVVDNASKVDEGKIIKERYSFVKIIRSDKNLGFSGGNNLAIKYALENNFEYVMLLNNDTIIKSNMISELLKNANENTIAVPKMYYYDDKNIIWYDGGYISKVKGSSNHDNMNKIDNNYSKNRNCTFATGCCILIHVNILMKIGLLNENYFMYCEDTEYCLRALKNNIKILYIPTAQLWHKVSRSTGGSYSNFATYYMTRNRFIYLKEYRTYFYFSAYIFTLFTRYIRIIQYFIKKDSRWKAIHNAVIDFKSGKIGEVDKSRYL